MYCEHAHLSLPDGEHRVYILVDLRELLCPEEVGSLEAERTFPFCEQDTLTVDLSALGKPEALPLAPRRLLKRYHSQKSEHGELLAFSSTHARVKVYVFQVAAALGLGPEGGPPKREMKTDFRLPMTSLSACTP